MSSQGRTLLKSLYYHSMEGITKGFIFMEGERVSDTGKEPLPEYELSDIVYDFEHRAYAIHGYSLLLKGVEYPFRGLGRTDFSIYSKSELEKITLYTIASYYSMGITLPIIETEFPEVFNKVAKEHNLQLVLVHEKGVIPHYSGVLYIEKDGEKLYFKDSLLGWEEKIICRPESLMEDCMILNAKDLELPIPAVILALSRSDPRMVFNKLHKPYDLLGLDNGFVGKGSVSDVVIYDFRSPLKQQPTIREILPRSPFRTPEPDIVIVRGEFAIEYGDFILAPIPKGVFKVED